MATVTDASVAVYLPRVHKLARVFNGRQGAEYDDLFQEGSEHVFKCLAKGTEPSNTGIKNAMRMWVRKCARHGIAYGDDV